MLCAAPRRSDVIRLGPAACVEGAVDLPAEKDGAEIDIPLLPQLQAAINAMPAIE